MLDLQKSYEKGEVNVKDYDHIAGKYWGAIKNVI